MKQMPSSIDYLSQLPAAARRQEILAIHQERQQWVNQPKKGFLRYRTPYESVAPFVAKSVDCTGDTVIIGRPDELSAGDQAQVKAAMRAFIPWRKGPFSVFGIDIDA